MTDPRDEPPPDVMPADEVPDADYVPGEALTYEALTDDARTDDARTDDTAPDGAQTHEQTAEELGNRRAGPGGARGRGGADRVADAVQVPSPEQLDGLLGELLHDTFGHREFRTLQREIVETVVGGEDAFVLMPTGGGKSLCYQLPALVRPGMAVVVSPLVALMKDQVDALRARGVAAAAYNSMLDGNEARAVLAQLHEGALDLLYVSPERLLMPDFIERLRSVPLALFAIDEAHCVSQWGHDFRPEYGQLGAITALFEGVPRIALTATADPYTKLDVVERLGMGAAKVFLGGFDRPNIRYRVVDKHKPLDQIAAFLDEPRDADGCGIIYCMSRKRTESVAHDLERRGVSAAAYHAGLSSDQRRRVQDAFLADEIDVVVATVAFGMGIDKPDVRFVVHHDLPRSLESYYPETGRAGRDGLPSDALLLYSPADAMLVHRLIEDGLGVERDAQQTRIEQAKLRSMTSYAEARTCRRQALLGYFGDEHDGSCDNCDVCIDPPDTFDATEPARMVLSCIYRVGERFGMRYVVDVLMGSLGQRIVQNGHDRLSTHGIGAEIERETWDAIVRQLIHAGYIEQDLASYSVLKLTARCRPLLRGEESIVLARPRVVRRSRGGGKSTRSRRGAPDVPADEPELSPADIELFEALRALRKRLASEKGVPPYVVFADRSLRDMCRLRPSNEGALLACHGVGPKKFAQYGELFLEVLAGGTGFADTD